MIFYFPIGKVTTRGYFLFFRGSFSKSKTSGLQMPSVTFVTMCCPSHASHARSVARNPAPVAKSPRSPRAELLVCAQKQGPDLWSERCAVKKNHQTLSGFNKETQ